MDNFGFAKRLRGLTSGGIAMAVFVARPLLRLHFVLYELDVHRAVFPTDEPVCVIVGPDPQRLLFIGDVAAAGYGVLCYEMATVSKTAHLITRERRCGCSWETIASPNLTAARVARMSLLEATGADAVIVMLGVSDVLLGTTSMSWAANLGKMVDRLRERAGPDCSIILAAIPPMADFRPIPLLARKAITLQIQRLNCVTEAAAGRISNVSFVPFPEWRVGDLYVTHLFSWKKLHEMWAHVLACATLEAMDKRPEGSGERPCSTSGGESPVIGPTQ